MRIAVVNLTSKGISGGYKKYLRNVIPRLAIHPKVEAMLCASPVALNVKKWLGPIPNVEFVDYSSNSTLKDCLKKFSPDVIFVPVERFFSFGNVPIVNMLQNMEPLTAAYGGNHISEQIQHWLRTCLAKKAIKRSDRIIAVSQFVKEFLTKYWGIPSDKIGLVYYGTEEHSFSPAKKPQLIPSDWCDNFIFTAGSIRPARGLEDLLLAISYLKDDLKKTIKLVIAGEANPNMMTYKNKLKLWTKELGISDKVCWTNNLNENEMAWCYKNCKAFIMTSRVESFGYIALEALSYGCLCISANNPCLPEIFKDAAIYYSPKDSHGLAEAVSSILSLNPKQKEKMSSQAKNRTAEFSWNSCAEKTIEELNKAITAKQDQK